MTYLGLESVRHGNSAACIEDIFRVHFPTAEVVADVTWGRGRFWKRPIKLSDNAPDIQVIGLDTDTRGGADIRADYRFVPLKHQTEDVLVLDPPIIFTPGIQRIVGAKRFFLGSEEGVRFNEDDRVQRPKHPGDLILHTLVVAREARRVARQGMILKGQELILSGRPLWWVHHVMSCIGEPEDMLIQVSPAPRLNDPKWKRQFHFRRRHAIYLVYKW